MAKPLNALSRHHLAQWLALGLVLLALGAVIAFNSHLEHGSTMAREQDRLSAQARVIAKNMESQLASANAVLKSIPGEISYASKPSRRSHVAAHIKALASALPGIRTISVLDATGKVIASNRPELVGVDLSYRGYFQTIKQQPDPEMLYVSPPFKTLLGVFGFNISRMISDPHGEFAGIVSATLDPEYFKPLMASVLYAPDMWDAIAHGDGQLFLTVPEHEVPIGINLAQPDSFFTRHRRSGQPATVLTGTVYTTKEMRMMAQHTVHPDRLKMDKPLVIAISRNYATIFRPWRRTTLTQAGLFGLVAMASMLGLYGYQRRQRLLEQRTAETAAALRESAERLQLATEASGVGVWDYDIANGSLVWDDAMYAIYGIDRDSPGLLDAWHDSLLPEDRAAEAAALEAAMTKGAGYAPQFRIRRSDGALRYIQARARIYLDANGKPIRMVGTNEDITERRQQEIALQESEDRFHSTFNAAAIGMALVGLEGRFIQANDALCRILGYSHNELQQKTLQSVIHPADLEIDLAPMQELLAGTRDSYQTEKRYLHKDGDVIWGLLSGSVVRDAAGQVLYFVAQIQDITERKAMIEQLRRQATQDSLTGLSNRRHFFAQGEIELARVRRYGAALSLLMLDVDHFKRINDSHGHKAGDIVLRQLSTTLRETLRPVDVIGRLGGEEFAVLLPGTKLAEAIEVAERLREIIAASEVKREAGLPLRFTVSIGVVSLEQPDSNLDTLLSLADRALYQAKAGGRNRVCVAD